MRRGLLVAVAGAKTMLASLLVLQHLLNNNNNSNSNNNNNSSSSSSNNTLHHFSNNINKTSNGQHTGLWRSMALWSMRKHWHLSMDSIFVAM